MTTFREHLLRIFKRDLRACLNDFLGVRILTPDQEKHCEALQTEHRVVAYGGAGTGKSWLQGNAGVIFAASGPSKVLFGGPRMVQATRLSWAEFRAALLRADQIAAKSGAKSISLSQPDGSVVSAEIPADRQWSGDGLSYTDWYPLGKDRPDWFASCMALSEADNAAGVQGMMHAQRVLAVLDELEGIHPQILDALRGGMTQDNAHFWLAFNPINPDSGAGIALKNTKAAGRVHYSALRTAEWQAKTGIKMPGMPTLEAIEREWKGREYEPLYYVYILGEFPPTSADDVIVPRDWFDKLSTLHDPDYTALTPVLGVDTGGGKAENVIASVCGKQVNIEWVSRSHHQTPEIVGKVKEIANRFKNRPAIVIDYLGSGGKGVGDDLAAEGYDVIPFVGSKRDFLGVKDDSGLYPDIITWAWFAFREAARLTAQNIDHGNPETYVNLPKDNVLREQLMRQFAVNKDKNFELAAKDRPKPALKLPQVKVSPDRADAVVMAWLYASICRVYQDLSDKSHDYENIVAKSSDKMSYIDTQESEMPGLIGPYGGTDENWSI